jgi:lipopolysaccharide transport system ATP-binding protein
MAIQFGGFAHELPAGAVIGCIGEKGCGIEDLLRTVRESGESVAMEYTLDREDAFGRIQTEAQIESSRRAGNTVLLASHNAALLQRLADEVWWIEAGDVRQKGHPDEVLRCFEQHVIGRYRALHAGVSARINPALRRGDGRAEIVQLETLDSKGEPVTVWQSGETVAVRVVVRFAASVEDPVVGIMIRTRIGIEVYGTNTELENVKVGPCAAGDKRTVLFTFECALCPQPYTLTAASHDPNGVWHDWLEDAIAFTVADTRYTAGVANLRARVTCSRE